MFVQVVVPLLIIGVCVVACAGLLVIRRGQRAAADQSTSTVASPVTAIVADSR